MTNVFGIYLAFRRTGHLQIKELKRWLMSVGKQFGFRIGHFATPQEFAVRFFRNAGSAMEVPEDCLLTAEITVGRFTDTEAWVLKDDKAKELMEGTHYRWTHKLTDYLPRPMATADYDKAMRTVFKDEEDPDGLRDIYLRCINGYAQTSLIRCLDAIWRNPAIYKGMFTWGETCFPDNLFELAWEDVLKDIWMHFCFFVEEDVGYVVTKLSEAEYEGAGREAVPAERDEALCGREVGGDEAEGGGLQGVEWESTEVRVSNAQLRSLNLAR